MLDLNHGSGFVYGGLAIEGVAAKVNDLIDVALMAERRAQPPRDYLGASCIGEPCARRLVYEIIHTPPDAGRDFDGAALRIFDAGHCFESLSIRWLRAAGFDLRTERRNGGQFGFSAVGGRLRGHIDGVIVGGPDVGLVWPALWEHKALNTRSWNDLVKHGLGVSKPIYFAQVQLYMAYMELAVTLFTALNKDTQALYHEVVAFDPSKAQGISDKAAEIIRAADAGELLPRIGTASDFYICRLCPYQRRCWEGQP